MKTKINPNVQIFGAGILLMQLSALVQEINGVRRSRDTEYVHRMRVATRRLRSALPLFGPLVAEKRVDFWFRRIRGVTRALGEARDTDVQILNIDALQMTLTYPVRSGVRRLLLRLKQRRRILQVNVLKALEDFEQTNIIQEIAQRCAPFDIYKETLDLKDADLLRLAAEAITVKLNDFLAYSEIVEQPEKVEELHAMRIAAKRLRYVLEFFTPLYENELRPYIKALRTTQDTLGNIHDCDVWDVYLPQFMQEERQRTIDYFGNSRAFKRLEPGLIYYQQVRRAERQKMYLDFVQYWREWQTEKLWPDLIDTIQFALAPEIVREPLAPETNVEEMI